MPVIKKIFQSICSLNIKDSFFITVLKVELLDHPHMTHPGFRVTLKIKHTEGTLKDNLQIDVGIGDIVNAKELTMSLLKYKSEPFFEDKISLKAYPPEFIFAEKLIAIISKGKYKQPDERLPRFNFNEQKYHPLKSQSIEKDCQSSFLNTKGWKRNFLLNLVKLTMNNLKSVGNNTERRINLQ